MKLRETLLLFGTTFAALAQDISTPPTNHWRSFRKSDGLAENACMSVTLGASGNVLVRHARSAAISEFNGYEFLTLPAPGTNRGRIYESPGGQLWTVTREGLLEFRDGEWTPHPVSQIAAHFRGGRTNEVRLQPIRQGRVLISLPGELLQLDASDPEHPQVESLPQTNQISPGVSTILLPDEFSVRRVFDTQIEPGGVVWFATADGLYRRAPELWEWDTQAPGTDAPLRNESRVTTNAISPLGWEVSFTAKNGDEWVGGPHGIAWRHQNSLRIFSSTNQLGPEEVFSFAESPDGRIWCGTPHKVWEFDGKNWLTLRGGFAQINALHCARDGTLWVATSDGLYRFTQGAWIANGPEDGLPTANIREIREYASGRITVETPLGMSAFHPEADPDPPRTAIVRTPTGGTNFREGAVVTLEFTGRDKWKLTSSPRLLFSYRLDEREWSPFRESREISFSDLPLGKHYFQVRAMDRNGNIDPKPARLEFTVVVPWYRETRLVLVLSVALGIAIFFAALAVNRHRKLRLSYAEVERKIAERTRELEIANRELLHSQKMNALGTLSAGIAHDFNNILSIVKGSAQIIEDNPGNPEKIRTRVDRIKTVVQQGAEVVEAMLGFSRSTDQPPTPCDLNIVVADTMKLLGDRFLRKVEVCFQRDADMPEISVPRDFVQQILLNLIFNAAEAMNEKKQITLTTQLTEKLPAELFLSPATAADYIMIAVRDCGSGIAPENMARIFEPFFTTKALSTKRGTGLGLSMVYELAKKMEAGLAVVSVVGQGSTFTLILPARELQPAKSAKS